MDKTNVITTQVVSLVWKLDLFYATYTQNDETMKDFNKALAHYQNSLINYYTSWF